MTSEPLREQLDRFNRERQSQLGGQFLSNEERLPIAHTGKGGDVAPPQGD